MITLYNVTSQDGFIAQIDGGEDFIPDDVWSDFLELLTEFDALLIGGNTYSTIQSFGKALVDPFEDTTIRKFVITRDKDLVLNSNYSKLNSIQIAATVAPNILLCSGPTLNTAFFNANLIDRIIINKLEISLHTGIGQFLTGISPTLELRDDLKKTTHGGRVLNYYTVTPTGTRKSSLRLQS